MDLDSCGGTSTPPELQQIITEEQYPMACKAFRDSCPPIVAMMKQRPGSCTSH